MSTLAEHTEKVIKERKEEFHYYVKELGYEKAKDIILRTTILKAVVDYVENYSMEAER